VAAKLPLPGRKRTQSQQIVNVSRVIAPVYITLSLLRVIVSNFNHTLFALTFFSRRQDRELPGAISRGLLDCSYRV
jgi:hypothetical protein